MKVSQIRGGELLANSESFSELLPKGGLAVGLAKALHTIVNPTITGGFLAGGLHAITGPDHLAAIIAPSVGKSGFQGLKIGAMWGVGHGVSAIALGLCVFFLKGQLSGFAIMEKLSTFAESAVGLSILFIGLMGIKEGKDAESEQKIHASQIHNNHFSHHHSYQQLNGHTKDLFGDHLAPSLTSLAPPAPTIDTTISTTAAPASPPHSGGISYQAYRGVFTNGLLHGFSWDGAPSLAPALAMTTWQGALAFLAAYSLGTIVTMSLAAGSLGEVSSRVGKASNNPDLPRKLSFVSSVMAVTIGVYLTAKSVIRRL